MPRAVVVPTVSPLNDFAIYVQLQDVNTTSGAIGPLTSGTVRAFFSTSKTTAAMPAHVTLETTAVHVGRGKWLVAFDGSLLIPGVLAPIFGVPGVPIYLILESAGSVRAYVVCQFLPDLAAVVS